MGSVDERFASDLRSSLTLTRAVETGTYEGETTRKLAAIFPHVVTIEASGELHDRAVVSLADLGNVQVLKGSSAERLPEVAADIPTLYYFDAHWSGGITAGSEDQCPVLREIGAVRSGHPDDCVIIDDARLFAAAHPPPADASQWPSLADLFDALRDVRPGHYVTVVNDQVIAIPQRAKDALNVYAWRVQEYPVEHLTLLDRLAKAVRSAQRRA